MMEKEITSALITALAAFLGTGIASYVAFLSVKKQTKQAMKTLSASHRAEIIRRQLNALETIWSIFDATSRSGGNGRIIQKDGDKIFLSISNTRQFIDLLEKTFNSKSGLYLSERCRRNLFDFRSYLTTIINKNVENNGLVDFNEKKLKDFYDKRRYLRLIIRKEVGSLDLKLTSEEISRYEEPA
ncbi:hypothetical protein N5923_19870 [Erwiniaceae bacterium BAC15a-03b]|uniref:Uncharacterized protein n=1 Tax=Winslowiella arboricola TaxID=2978220 RepID=A0A9J6PSS3_9GAMM|nr:hypothetical protein [Winslowiella arboricola]MCU5772456.1 hypothetical protein [Winslowiella arboricola]MCU5779750.1 hypothetical protein [Winslowiella arboricola]